VVIQQSLPGCVFKRVKSASAVVFVAKRFLDLNLEACSHCAARVQHARLAHSASLPSQDPGIGHQWLPETAFTVVKMAEERRVTFDLNGVSTTIDMDPTRLLLDVLREDLGLTGTKRGCDDEGQCGACTVLLNGRAVRACRTRVEQVAGQSVVTIEGIGSPGHLHPLQQAFIDCGAVQCGFCTPGMILAGKALLDRNPNPTYAEVARALTGHLCRCTGYKRIIQAVLVAARRMDGAGPGDAPVSGESVIGGDARRLEAVGRVTGETRFAGDMKMADMLVAKVLRSPHPYARILSIDSQAALELPGVEAVLTAADIPGIKAFSDKWASRTSLSAEPDDGANEPVLALDRVRMVGDPVAIAVAVDAATVQAALDKVQITYELLEPVFDARRALQASAPQLHPSGNLYEYGEIKVGDPGAAWVDSEVDVAARFSIPSREHAAIEPESALAWYDVDGRVVVFGPTHQPHMRQRQIAEMLAIPVERVRVVAAPQGGSFGSRHHFWLTVAIALPAFLLRRPVRMIYSRREVFEATYKDYPFDLEYRIGATAHGRLTGLWARGYGNAGPYGGAPTAAPFVALCGSGPYIWQAIDYEVRLAHTNAPNAGPLRGYSMPHGVLGLECSLDELAQALEIDPWELRVKNAANQSTGTCTGQAFDEPFGFKQALQAIKPDWDRALVAKRDWDAPGEERYGVGLAAGWYQFGKAGKLQVPAEAELSRDGRFTLYFSAMNSGQGLDTVMNQLAAEELGLPRDMVALVNNDTDATLDSGIYGACKSTYWVGGAIVDATRRLKRALLGTAAGMLGTTPTDLSLSPAGISVTGGRDGVAFCDIAAAMERQGVPLRYTGVFDLHERYPDAESGTYLGHFSSGVALAEVAVNISTGKTRVVRLVVAQDVGRAVNPIDVQGQIEGGMAMEMGAALMEEYVPGITMDFKRYHIPRVRDMPEMKVIVVEVASHEGPFGAKGVGEAASGHVRAALINAISDAAGVRIRRIPVSPEHLLTALARAPV
jgi:aldehyde oxidoreductase